MARQRLLAGADNWLINVQPLASESKSTGLQPEDVSGVMKLLSHLDNEDEPVRRTQGVCVSVCVNDSRVQCVFSNQDQALDLSWARSTLY